MAEIKRREFLQRVGQAAAVTAGAASLQGSDAGGFSRKIRVGQIGTKHAHAAGKMGALRTLAGQYEVVGVVEPDESRRRAVENSRPYRDLSWMTEEELLNVKGLQAVAVETDVPDLIPTALRCVEAGLHIHLDKPPGNSLGRFGRVLEAAASKKVVVQMGYMLRYNPAFQFLYRAARDGWLGEIFELHAVMSKTIGDAARKDLLRLGGGGMYELGCHLIDSMVTVLGKPDRVTTFSRRTRPERDSLEDNQLSVFEYPRATASIRIALVEYMGQRRRQFVVCGDQGTIDIKPLESGKMQVALSRPRGKYQRGYQSVELPLPGDRYDGDLADLARIIRGEKAPDWGPEHDLAVHRAVLEASGMPVD